MDAIVELRKILHKMMLKEVSKAEADNNKAFEDSYYGKEVSTVYYESNIKDFDREEYELGMQFTKLLLDHTKELDLNDLVKMPNAAVVFAKNLLVRYGLSYPVCFDIDNRNGIKYFDQELIDEKRSELFDKIDKLFEEGRINQFEKYRLVKAAEFLYDEDMLHKEFYQSERYTRKRTNN